VLRILHEHTAPPQNAWVVSAALDVDALERATDKATPDGLSRESLEGQRSDREHFFVRESPIEVRRHSLRGTRAPAAAPVEPPEASNCRAEHLRNRVQARPFLPASNQTFLDPVSDDVSHALQESWFIEDRLGRVSALPERALPADELSYLLGNVREQVPHELREVGARSSDEEVEMVRGSAEDEQLDPMRSNGAHQYATQDVVRLVRWTE
jgi:hypothetical protein